MLVSRPFALRAALNACPQFHGSIVGEQLEPELELGPGFPVVPFAADFAVDVGGVEDRFAHPFWPR